MDSYNIILIGKTGHGKSSTGNTILRKEIFDTTDNAARGTTLVEKKSSVFNNIIVDVYDIPGLMDLESTETEDKNNGRRNMDLVMASAKMLSALIIVYKYNTTFSKEESKTIDILEEFFGRSFLANHGVIVVTCGDVLDRDIPEGETRESFFRNWCLRQKPRFRQLLYQVNNRILLVNNKGNFSETSMRLTSSKQILEMVIRLRRANGHYTKEEYDYLKRWCTVL